MDQDAETQFCREKSAAVTVFFSLPYLKVESLAKAEVMVSMFMELCILPYRSHSLCNFTLLKTNFPLSTNKL